MDGIDAGLAADGRVDLGQKAGRDLDEIHAAAEDRCRESREIADHPAAQGDDAVAPFDAGSQQFVADIGKLREGLGSLARRHDDRMRSDARGGQRVLQGSQVGLRDVAVGDDGGHRPPQQGADDAAGTGQQAFADDDVVAAVAECDSHGLEVFLVSHSSTAPSRPTAPGRGQRH